MHIGLLPDPRCYAVTLDFCGAVRYRTAQVFQVQPVPALPLCMRNSSLWSAEANRWTQMRKAQAEEMSTSLAPEALQSKAQLTSEQLT
jgi:hypothetical protein